MVSGQTDLLAGLEDVNILLYKMDKAGIKYEHKSYNWGHLGFVIADKLNVAIDDTEEFFQI